MPRRLSVAEIEIAEYRSMGIKPDPEDQRTVDMEYLLRIEKQRLIEMHATEVSGLHADIKGWETHTSELGGAIRKERRRVDKLYLALFGAILVILYLYGNAVRCKP